MKAVKRRIRSLLAALCVVGFVGNAAAQAPAYPARYITVVVPYGPGSVTDLVARIVSDEMTRTLGQNVVVVNKGGAGGAVAAVAVRSNAPDGYTIMMGSSGSLLLRPTLDPEPAYNVGEFTAIGKAVYIPPLLLVGSNKVRATTFNEMVRYIATNDTSFATGHDPAMLAAAELLNWKHLKAVRIPYNSEPKAVEGLLAGQTSWMFLGVAIARQFVEEKQIRAYATLGVKRYPSLPDVPTVAELGAPELTQRLSWLGLFGPKGMPNEVVVRLSGALKMALENSDVRERLTKLNFEVSYSNADALSSEAADDLRHIKSRVEVLSGKKLISKR